MTDGILIVREDQVIADFTVDGIPEPKGSMTPARRGGKIVMLHGMNHKRKDGTRGDGRERYEAWERSVVAAATVWQLTHKRRVIEREPLVLTCAFFLPRPKSLPKSVEYPTAPPDLDKLARMIGDCLKKGGLISDDAVFVDLNARKRFAFDKPCVRIIVSTLLERAA
jgi:Holliday junction resolvase RusA-like endonuclease